MGTLIVAIIALALYFLPWINSMVSKHHNSGAILVLNLFLGWTIIGWIAALVWSATKPKA